MRRHVTIRLGVASILRPRGYNDNSVWVFAWRSSPLGPPATYSCIMDPVQLPEYARRVCDLTDNRWWRGWKLYTDYA